jgi:hypothetical protein
MGGEPTAFPLPETLRAMGIPVPASSCHLSFPPLPFRKFY